MNNESNLNERKTMKDLPLSERPYEKCLAGGPAFLSDAELLAVILRSGTSAKTSLQLAEELLTRFGTDSGLAFLRGVTRSELKSVSGIGDVKATELLAAGELARRMAASQSRQQVQLNRPDSIADYFMEELCYLSHEEMRVAMFNTKNRLLGCETISVGTVNASLASPREIFLTALKHGAVYLVVIHNHPSGDPQPSAADISLTRRLCEVGELLQVPVLDHIIIGDHRWLSFRERGLIPACGAG